MSLVPMDEERGWALLAAADDFVRPLVLERFDVHSCVATVRVAIDALAYFGVRAVPAPVEVMIFNDEAVEMLRHQGASLEDVGAAAWNHSVDDPEGPWTMGLGFKADPSEGGGHMGFWVPGLHAFADPSLDQVSRPRKGLALGPMYTRNLHPDGGREPGRNQKTFPDVLLPGMRWSVDVDQAGGRGPAHLEYEVIGDDWFRVSPNWRRTSTTVRGGAQAFREVTGEAIRLMREAVDD